MFCGAYQTTKGATSKSQNILRQRCRTHQHQPQTATHPFLHLPEDQHVPETVAAHDAPTNENHLCRHV